MPRVWTKTGLVRSAADASLAVPLSAPRTPDGRAVVRDYTAVEAHASFTDSIERIQLGKAGGTPPLAGLRIHDPNDNGGEADDVATALAADGMLAGLRELRAAGLIGHVSLGMNANRMAPDILRLLRGAEGTFDSCLLAGGWNLLNQNGGPVMEEATKQGIVIHNAGSLASGLLAGGYTYAYAVAEPEMVERRDRWAALAAQFGVELPAVAFAFASAPAVVAKLVVGPATPEQVADNLR